MKKIFLILTIMISLLQADSYLIKYKGITLGKIENLTTLNQNYLKAKVTNSIVRFMMRKDFFVFYDGNKPDFSKTKYKKDNKKIIYALKEAIALKPSYEDVQIDEKRHITLSCKDKICKFDYYSDGNHNANGKIEFKDDKFYKLTEEQSSLEIIKE